uniref:Uncharacterized protein n=1 Tax=Denticeps clupeoides TaxID=299321 RepID=A0AAY4AKD4_9TELE
MTKTSKLWASYIFCHIQTFTLSHNFPTLRESFLQNDSALSNHPSSFQTFF